MRISYGVRVTESTTRSRFNHPIIALVLLLGVVLSLFGDFFGPAAVSKVGTALSLGALSLLWFDVIHQRQFTRIAKALWVTLLLLVAITLDAWFVPAPWTWFVLALLILGFFGVALRMRSR